MTASTTTELPANPQNSESLLPWVGQSPRLATDPTLASELLPNC